MGIGNKTLFRMVNPFEYATDNLGKSLLEFKTGEIYDKTLIKDDVIRSIESRKLAVYLDDDEVMDFIHTLEQEQAPVSELEQEQAPVSESKTAELKRGNHNQNRKN